MISIIAISLLLLSILVSCNDKHSDNKNGIGNTDSDAVVVDIFENIEIDSYGMNNYAYLEANVYDNSITSINISSYVNRVFGSRFNIPGNLYNGEEYGEWYDLFDIEVVGDNKNLSNGDTVILRAQLSSALLEEGETLETLMDALGIRLSRTEMTYVVSDLKDGTVIDMFELLEEYMVFSGADGYGYLDYCIPEGHIFEKGGYYIIFKDIYHEMRYCSYRFELIHNNRLLSTITLAVDGYGLLDEGDVATVRIKEKVYFSEAGEDYYLVTSAQYTVPELGDLITCKDDLMHSDIAEIMNYVDSELIGAYGEDQYSIERAYFATIQPHATIQSRYEKAAIVVVFKCDSIFGTKTKHLTICSPDFYRKLDGSLNFPTDASWSSSHENDDPNDLSNLDQDYTYEIIQ